MWSHWGYVVGWLAAFAVLGVDLGVTQRGSTGRWVGFAVFAVLLGLVLFLNARALRSRRGNR